MNNLIPFNDFLNESAPSDVMATLAGVAADKISVTPVDPIDKKGRWDFEADGDDGSKNVSITFEVGKKSFTVDFDWEWTTDFGLPGASRDVPDDTPETVISAASVNSVYIGGEADDAVALDKPLKKKLEAWLKSLVSSNINNL